MADLGFSFIAGLLSILSPCVLPLVPIIFASAFQSHKYGAFALAGGLIFSYAVVGVFLASAGFAIGISDSTMRTIAGLMMIAFALLLLSSGLQARFATATGTLSASANDYLNRLNLDSLPGQFITGALLGVVWTPCVGPTLGAAISLAAQGQNLGQVTLVMLVYGIGATAPLLVLAYGSRQAFAKRRDGLLKAGRWAKPVLGCILLVIGLLALTGLDKMLENALLSAMPDWLRILVTSY